MLGNGKIKTLVYQFAWLIGIVGVVFGLYIGFNLDVPVPGYETLTNPHPLRWVYGGTILFVSIATSVVMMGIAENINQLETMNDYLRTIKQDIRDVQSK